MINLYEDEEECEKAATMLDRIIPDPKNADPDLTDDLLQYARVMEKNGRIDDTLSAYKRYVSENSDSDSWIVNSTKSKIEEIESGYSIE